jgi:hypothetical protein
LNKNKPEHKVVYTGVGLALGAGVGAALFAATGEAWYIGIGVGVGLLIGAIMDSRYKKQSRDHA